MEKSKRVMVFGVFDRLHEGHRSFLHQAAKYGSELIAVVARDATVRELKQKILSETGRQRAAALRRVFGVWKVVNLEVQPSKFPQPPKFQKRGSF